MDNLLSGVANADDHVGIPDDMRCKRSDGKQWRCTAMSMPDKTVCEKHYIQAKKRAANSALRASMKKAKRKPVDETHLHLESKSDDKDLSLMDVDDPEFPVSSSLKIPTDSLVNNEAVGSPKSPPLNDLNLEDSMQTDSPLVDEYQKSLGQSPPYAVESSRNMSQKSTEDGAAATNEDHSDASTDTSSDSGGVTCHQCRRSDKGSIIWCLKCNRRGYCGSCISTCYLNISMDEIERCCPACRGSCKCKVCSRVDNLIKARIRDIPALDKLRYLCCLLSSVLPVVKRIHLQQCAEIELEKKLQGQELDVERLKLNADEQMCCDCCRVPIVDYHRHCSNCSYDLCLSCCQDLRETTPADADAEYGAEVIHLSYRNQSSEMSDDQQELQKHRLLLNLRYPGWSVNKDGSIPCLPREHGGCGSYLTLQRIFKMNWITKLVKNLEEIVNGCKVHDFSVLLETQSLNSRFHECAHRKNSEDNFLYCPFAQEIKTDGIDYFRKHWAKGEPVLVKEVCDILSSASWDPMVMWREICEVSDDKVNATDKIVKAVDCLDSSEVDIELRYFMKGYSEGRISENGWPQLLKLKDWPSPTASEEFFLYQRPEFISKVPFLEFIHSKFGLLNVAAKLPHYSLQNDVGPKIYISYGFSQELGRGDSVTNLHMNMRDMVYVLVHSYEVEIKGWQQEKVVKLQQDCVASEVPQSSEDACRDLNEEILLGFPEKGSDGQGVCRANLDINVTQPIEDTENQSIDLERECMDKGTISSNTCPGAIWDVFRREDIPKIAEYLKEHQMEIAKSDTVQSDLVRNPLYDEAVYLRSHHKTKLKEEFGVEPWSFEQSLGQAVFVPAGCPFQVRNLQATVQLGLDFLSPESLGQAVKLADEIRILPNDHAAKLQMVEVGKISLYAASSGIKEVQKLVLDHKLGTELEFEDRNLTAMVSENLRKCSNNDKLPVHNMIF